MEDYYTPQPQEFIKRERKKARELRQSQWWKQKVAQGVCYYCEERFSKENLTMDHKVPIARGGQSKKSNLVVSCKECNSQKQSLTPAEMLLKGLSKEL